VRSYHAYPNPLNGKTIMPNDFEAAKKSYESFVTKLKHQSTQVSGPQNTSPLELSQSVL
jgi:hypothetical protein